MAENENVNKVVYGNNTLIDLTEDTVVPEALVSGYTAHDRSGATVTGTLSLPSSSNPLSVDSGGTGANSASAARTNLSVYSKAETDSAITQSTAFHVGDTFSFNGTQIPFRTLSDKSAIYFRYRMPKNIGSDVTSFTISFTANSATWFSGGSIGAVQSGATAGNIAIAGNAIAFSVPPSGTIASTGFGICELAAIVTFA